jgi:hypothetical protein
MPSGYVSQSRSSTAVCPSEPESIVKHADGLFSARGGGVPASGHTWGSARCARRN